MYAKGRGLACDWFGAGLAFLGVQAAEALEAVGAVVPGGEVLTGQLHFTVGANEALPVPRLVPIGHAPLGQGLRVETGQRSVHHGRGRFNCAKINFCSVF